MEAAFIIIFVQRVYLETERRHSVYSLAAGLMMPSKSVGGGGTKCIKMVVIPVVEKRETRDEIRRRESRNITQTHQ